MGKLKDFLLKIQELTRLAEESGDTVEDMLINTAEELGEVSACISTEKGRKRKNLKEDSKQESIDVVICALIIYFAKGGDPDEVAKIGLNKLEKWRNNILRRKESAT